MPYADPKGEGNKAAHKRYYEKNKQKFMDAKRNHRESNRALVFKAKSVACMDCGFTYPYYVMDFDHINPTDKLFTIGIQVYNVSEKKLLEEIAKCDVVCANCHRIRTWKHLN